MSKYYSKIALTIPETKDVLLSKSIDAVDTKLKGKSIIELQKILSKPAEDLRFFRILLFCVSKALSVHGIAPRWQGLQDACQTQEQLKALTADAPVIDLFWLPLSFPKHKTKNQRWQKLFSDGFDLELALSISARQITTARKIRDDLDLTRFQQIGCIHFLRKSKYQTEGEKSALSFLQSAEIRSQNAYKREIKRSATLLQVTSKVASQRALICLCWELAEESPTDTATIYKWMTGLTINKANIARTIKRMKTPVSR
jgi:hypothetical protein